MKLMKHALIKVEDHGNNFTISEEMISDDLNELKSKANELCQLINVKPSAWTSRYPIMGNNPIKSNTEWVMMLANGDVFSIEK